MQALARHAAFLLLGLAAACVRPSVEVKIEGVELRDLGPGVELVRLDVGRSRKNGGRIHAIYADPSRIRLSLALNEGRSPLKDLEPDALAVTNAAFFTPKWKPTGLLVSDGKTLNRLVRRGGPAGSGVLVLEDGRLELLEREQVGKRSFAKAELAIQAGPRIIEPGEEPGIHSDDGSRASRTFVGSDRSGRLVLGVAVGPVGWTSGFSLFEIQHLLGRNGLGQSDHAKLALSFALNLDGGPSTGMYVRHDSNPVAVSEAAPVYSALVLRQAP